MVAKINYCKRTAMLDGKDNMGKREGRKEGRKESVVGRTKLERQFNCRRCGACCRIKDGIMRVFDSR